MVVTVMMHRMMPDVAVMAPDWMVRAVMTVRRMMAMMRRGRRDAGR